MEGAPWTGALQQGSLGQRSPTFGTGTDFMEDSLSTDWG